MMHREDEKSFITNRIKEVAKEIRSDNFKFDSMFLVKIQELRLEILMGAGFKRGIYFIDDLQTLVLMMQLLDDLVKDQLNIELFQRVNK